MLEDFFGHVQTREYFPWPEGRFDWHVHVLLDEHAAHALTAPYAGLFDHVEHLVPVPAAWFHITVAHLAPDQVPGCDDGLGLGGSQVGDLRAGLEERLAGIEPFWLRLGRGHQWERFGVACPVLPAHETRRLWETARTVAAEVAPDAPSLPLDHAGHGSIAYSTGPADTIRIRRWLADHYHQLPEITTRVDRVHLLRQRHQGGYITWDSPGTPILLGTGCQPAGGTARPGEPKAPPLVVR